MNDRAPDPADPRESALRQELLAYLGEHPHAVDTLEGIAGWWLPRHQIRIGVERIARALEELTQSGELEEVPGSDPPLYRLRRREGPDAGGAPPSGPAR